MSEKSPELKLHEKLFKARKEAQAVARKGKGSNGHEEFQFSPFEDVLVEGKRLLEKHRIFYIPRMVEEELYFGQKGCLAKCVIEYEVIDLSGGGKLTMRWAGSGFDSPGGTALFMAETGTEKYFLCRLLQIPFGTEPEEGGGSPTELVIPPEERVADDDPEAVRAEQDRDAEAPQAPPARHERPLPTSDHPPAEWEREHDEEREPASV